MIFTYKKWDVFCKKLSDFGISSIPAREVSGIVKNYLTLKHDVETNVKKAFIIAEIEHRYGHRGSYYVQAYLLNDSENIKILKKMQQMGHEISYHYDVMDSNKGNIDCAIKEFEKNKQKFEKNGFDLVTVCQHGNPVVERIGYTSNRDFFRKKEVQEKYSSISDIMVNFKEKANTEYSYFSDAGRKFKRIFDPINNDINDSSDNDVVYENLEELFKELKNDGSYILSTHPHRWTKSITVYIVKTLMFKVLRFTAKIMMKIPFAKKIMSRYYYLAKKI